MYLEEIYLENTGPITKCHIKPPFADNGNPLPVVIVGPNGSGKSIFLSYIIDALTEFAKRTFDDIVPSDGLNTPYFRVVSGTAIRSGQPFSLSLLRFKANGNDLHYCEKSGVLDHAAYSPNVKPIFAQVWNWPTDENHKGVSVNEKIIETEMRKSAHAFFPASRREDPDWLNPKSLNAEPNPFSPQFNRQLDKPLWVETCAGKNIPWILDVFLDSLIDPELLSRVRTVGGRNIISGNVSPSEMEDLRNRSLLGQSRQNVESILQSILQDGRAKLDLNYRNIGPSRISIKMKDGRIIPTLQSLSEGQSQLFHLFATIIRYGEHADLNKSVRLSEITGLVVIDEIAAHLHPTLQHDVLPQLISRFPKVQFIVSSHSPLFLLGMEKEFGPDGLAILELPHGVRITSERFTEFDKAFTYYQATKHFEEEIKQRFANMTKPVVLTEGKTDAQYIQTALTLLGEKELLNSLEIEPVGKEGNDGDDGGGKTGLDNFRKVYSANPLFFRQPILLLYDSDAKKVPDPVEKLVVKSIPPNNKNSKVKGGIENLFPADLFQDCFYDEKLKERNDGGQTIIRVLNKPKFCKWVCEQQNANHFANFGVVVDILKEIVKTHQTVSNQ